MEASRRDLTPGAAIFVKTPGRSPVKTRLAATVGAARAEGFYAASVRATAAAVRAAAARTPLAPYWAVAEEEACDDPRWTAFPTIAQGDGGLGQRLDRVYRRLLASHGAAILLGADGPALRPERLLDAAVRLAEALAAPEAARPWLLGPTEDGGFDLFAGTREIPPAVWQAVPYGEAETAGRLVAALAPYGPVVELPRTFDVDVAADLARLLAEEPRHDDWLPEQRDVFRLAERLLEGTKPPP